MTAGSLRWRLLAAGYASVVLALAVAGLGLAVLFERHVERRVVAEMELQLRQLVDGVGRNADGALELSRSPAEPRFREPLSGLYWQIANDPPDGQPPLRSRSLWDAALELPADTLRRGEVHEHQIPGPAGATLLVVERSVALPVPPGGGIRAAVAQDRAEIRRASLAFAREFVPFLGLLALFLCAAAYAQVAIGLRPLGQLRRLLEAVRAGRQPRLGSGMPEEVQPLAAQVDRLLDARDAALQAARARAADLAHGLRTPLTVLAEDARRLRALGEVAVAEEIEAVTAGMRRHVERELARARAGFSPDTKVGGTRVSGLVEQLIAVVRRMPRGQEIAWEAAIPAGLAVRVAPEDLAEILGNLLENACKWAATEVRVSATPGAAGGLIGLVVADDGAGIATADIAQAVARGGRLDSQAPGSGLGLTIVAELVEGYGGTLDLGRSALGGLAVTLQLPAA